MRAFWRADHSTQAARVLLAAAMLLVSVPCHAQATGTWVSGVGIDVNDVNAPNACSRTAPCRTFAGALAFTAAGGVIVALDAGSFGPVTISQSITIDGGQSAAGISGASQAIVVQAGPTDRVVIRNLTLSGAGNPASAMGVVVAGAGHVVLDRVRIERMSQAAIRIASPSVVEIRNSQLFSAPVGIGVESTATVSVTSTTIEGMETGIAATQGLVNVHDSVLFHNLTAIRGRGKAVISTFQDNKLYGNTRDNKFDSKLKFR